jgi:N-acetylglucosaminyldiphosphoundecaprenol N-acetyl-beta-D-mannosaminyltransferase
MHGVTEAQHDPEFKRILNAADLVVPDGMPLVWIARQKGFPLRRRVYGPELMLAFCEVTAKKGYRHFFYGGAPGVAEALSDFVRRRFPGVQISGTYCPPFRQLTPEEEREITAQIGRAKPDIVWIGLSTPKQERWMFNFRSRLAVPLMVGVGAAFDIHTGRVKQAPAWMQEHGLEWFFRFTQEPRRLWRRYFLYGPKFAYYVMLELLHLRSFD